MRSSRARHRYRLLVGGIGIVVTVQLTEPLFAGVLVAALLVDLVLVAGILGPPLAVARALEAASVEEPAAASVEEPAAASVEEPVGA